MGAAQQRSGLVRHLADGATLVEHGGDPASANEAALAQAADLAERPPAGFLDAVPGARTLLILFDPDRLAHAELERILRERATVARRLLSRTIVLPAHYGGEAGPDLEQLSRDARIAAAELARLHATAEHRVAFLGFAPGFAYLSGAPRELAVPRLRTPRLRVPAGTLAVADGYSGIYPGDTPGGWRLIGRVAARLFDPAATPPALLRPGDRVVFERVPLEELRDPGPAELPVPAGVPLLRLLTPGASTTVQGGPRYGLSSSGVPAGGAMDLPALAEGNAAVGNPPFAAGLEITVAGPELELLQDATFAIAGAPLEALLSGRKLDPSSPQLGRKGERLKLGFVRQGVRAYVCLQGGLALPLPGAQAKALRSGDEIARADAVPAVASLPPRRAGWTAKPALIVRAIPGPQTDHFTAAGRETFFSSEYRVSPQSDRRGLRLDGPTIDLFRSADLAPEGTAPGAVQVPGGGLPIVLGPDRPQTGGYPKIATVIGADLPLLAQARPGTTIRFRPATLEEALAARRGSR